MKDKKESKGKPAKARKTKRERYEEDLKTISKYTPEEATRAILGGATVPKQ